MNTQDEKFAISREEYNRLWIEQVKEIRRTVREEKKSISLHDAASIARQIVSDFYEIEEG